MAVINKVLIGNMALSKIGVSTVIESFDEESTQAKQIKTWYDYSRLQTLAAYDWNFARKRLSLAVHGDAAPTVWDYRYQYPADCVSMRELENPLGSDADAIPWEVELDLSDASRSIITDQDEAVGIYTKDLETTAFFSPHFVESLSTALANHIAFSLSGKLTVERRMAEAFQELIRVAPAHNANEGMEKPPRDTDWIRERQ